MYEKQNKIRTFCTKNDYKIHPIDFEEYLIALKEVKLIDEIRLYYETKKSQTCIRISSKNFGFENNILSVPLHAIFCIKK